MRKDGGVVVEAVGPPGLDGVGQPRMQGAAPGAAQQGDERAAHDVVREPVALGALFGDQSRAQSGVEAIEGGRVVEPRRGRDQVQLEPRSRHRRRPQQLGGGTVEAPEPAGDQLLDAERDRRIRRVRAVHAASR